MMKISFKYVLSTFLIVFVSACAHQIDVDKPDEELIGLVRSGIGIDGKPSHEALIDVDPFTLTEEMKLYVKHFSPKNYPAKYKVDTLVRALTSQSGLNLRYNPLVTHTAAKSFELREANCLSYTILFYALATEVGLQVQFNEVDVPPVWDIRDGNRLVFYKHVNAIVDITYGKSKVVDINMENYSSLYAQRRMSKTEALSMYFNNRGVEAMERANFADAHLYFMRALEANGKAGYVWGNLGALYKRIGDFEIVEALYLKAIAIDGYSPIVASNLARAYRQQGLIERASAIEVIIKTFRDANPYYQYLLAQLDFSNGNDESAIVHVDKAIELYPKEHRFHQLRAQLMARQGNSFAMLNSLKYANGEAILEKDKAKYRSKIEKIEAIVAFQK